MECGICRKIARFVCPCKYILLCSDHLASHISLPGRHTGETLYISLSNSESEELRKEALNRIQLIEVSKTKIISVAMTLIKKIESSSEKAVQELDDLLRLYMTMLNLSNLSDSLKLEFEKILSNTMKIKEVSFDLGAIIEESFNKDLVMFTEINQVAETSKDTTKEEIKKNEDCGSVGRKSIRATKCIQKKQINKKEENQLEGNGLNTWTLIKKHKFMKSLKISNYQVNFSGSKRDWIQEIKFSNNGNYSFICKNHEGMLKQNITV